MDTSQESQSTCSGVFEGKNASLPVIPAFLGNDPDKFVTKTLASSLAIHNSTPITHSKNRRATFGYSDFENRPTSILPGYLGNSPDRLSLPAARRISLGSCEQRGSLDSSPIPKRAKKGLAGLFKSRKQKTVSVSRKKSIKRKGTKESLDLSTVSSEGLLEFLEGLSPKKRSVSFYISNESGKSDSSSLNSQGSKDSPDIYQEKPYVAKRKALRIQFHRLMAETERLRDKDIAIRAKFLELQQKRLLLSLDLNPNSPELLHLTQQNKVKQDAKPRTKKSALCPSIPRGLKGWGRSKSTPNLVDCSNAEPIQKLFSDSMGNFFHTDIIFV